ncbi:hypothetical protein BDW62DRAFT_219453 [Aspergillus aurantiobrunneus]
MAITWGRRAFSRRRNVHLPLLTAILLCLLWGRPPPRSDLAAKPRFLHYSPFRRDADREYEAGIDKLLRRIEARALRQDSADAAETIWQVMLDPKASFVQQGTDAVAFEQANAEWAYKLIPSGSALAFVETTFQSIPDLVHAYRTYPYDVLRADVLRYLLLWFYGGYYADMDVYPARSIKACPALRPIFHPQSPATLNISLVVGIEIDEPYASPRLIRDWHWSRSYGFIQYNMYAPRRFSPVLRKAIVRALAHTKQYVHKGGLFARPRYTERDILEITGPGMFTDAVLDVLSDSLPASHFLIQKSVESDATGELNSPAGQLQRLTWAPFHKLPQPLWLNTSDVKQGMDGLGVLPVNVWGNGQRHSGAGLFDDVQACVNHRFGRTWKKGWWEYLW